MDLFAFIRHSDPTKVGDARQEHSIERDADVLKETVSRDILELREDYHVASSNMEGKSLAVIRGLVSDGSSVLSRVTKHLTIVLVTPTSPATDVLVTTIAVTTIVTADASAVLPLKVRVKSKNLEIFGDSTSAGDENVNVAERDAEIAHLKSLLSLKEYEAVEAIRLYSQLSIVEAVDAAKGNELRDLKERKFVLEGEKDVLSKKGTTLESVAALKEAELVSLTAQRDMLADQRSSLEFAFELFKGHTEAMQDEQAKAIGYAVNKGIRDGLKAGVDHRKARRDLSMIEAYDPFAEARYIDAVNALGIVDFSLLSEVRGEIEEKRLSLINVMVPLAEPLSLNSLIGEASTSAIPATTEPITTLSMTFSSSDVVPPLSISNDQALDTKPNDEDPSAVTFEKEELKTFSKVVGSTIVMVLSTVGLSKTLGDYFPSIRLATPLVYLS
uniref:Uncharacterized protein n=1 Tax=Tanacetum cinerariifolium TaxID=118510 RepID=A0A6L2KP73_TANCI|nr:hypothetical protein [Tanacetum cinerariifolium]